jgi:hypothetical protein
MRLNGLQSPTSGRTSINGDDLIPPQALPLPLHTGYWFPMGGSLSMSGRRAPAHPYNHSPPADGSTLRLRWLLTQYCSLPPSLPNIRYLNMFASKFYYYRMESPPSYRRIPQPPPTQYDSNMDGLWVRICPVQIHARG